MLVAMFIKRGAQVHIGNTRLCTLLSSPSVHMDMWIAIHRQNLVSKMIEEMCGKRCRKSRVLNAGFCSHDLQLCMLFIGLKEGFIVEMEEAQVMTSAAPLFRSVETVNTSSFSRERGYHSGCNVSKWRDGRPGWDMITFCCKKCRAFEPKFLASCTAAQTSTHSSWHIESGLEPDDDGKYNALTVEKSNLAHRQRPFIFLADVAYADLVRHWLRSMSVSQWRVFNSLSWKRSDTTFTQQSWCRTIRLLCYQKCRNCPTASQQGVRFWWRWGHVGKSWHGG